jgi:serine/threonine protein kinase
MEGRIGKYQLKSELGRGMNSVVWLVFDEFLNSDLALKVYQAQPGMSLPVSADVQFVSEAALAGRLVHPNIVTIIDAVAEEGRRYVAMEYVAGGNLARHTRPGTLLPVSDVIQIAFKCSSALDYASRQGVVHRDIKPSNVLLGPGLEVKVTDFGAAFVAGVATTQRFRLASPSYTAPEQIRDEPPSAQSDMFSLGVMLLELLTGERPFRASTDAETLERVLRMPAPAPSRLRPELPRSVDDIVLRMLQKSGEDRYPTWADAALDLARVGRLSVYEQDLPDSEKLLALRASPITAALDPFEQYELARAARWRRVPAQTVILREGEQGDSLFLMASGEAKVTVQGRLLDVLRRGDCFGDMGYAQGPEAVRSATIQAGTDAVVAEIPSAALEALPDRIQLKLVRTLLRVMAERLAFGNQRLSRQPS